METDLAEIKFIINFHYGCILKLGISIIIANSTDENIPPFEEVNSYKQYSE